MLRGHAGISGEDGTRPTPSGCGGCGVGGGDGRLAAEFDVTAISAVEGSGNTGVQNGVLTDHSFRTSTYFEGQPLTSELDLTSVSLCVIACLTVSPGLGATVQGRFDGGGGRGRGKRR